MPEVRQFNNGLQGHIPIKETKGHAVPDHRREVTEAVIKLRNINTLRTLSKPFTCSKCAYTAVSRQDLKDHWLLEHD